MRVVVTGGTGNVGTSVVRALAADPSVEEVVAVARRQPHGPLPQGARFAAADVATDDLEPIFRGAEAVVHLAWLFQPTHDPETTWRVNAQGSLRVFEAAAAAGAEIVVYASSVGAYSPAPHGAVVDESWPTHSVPTANYGREKAYVERGLDAFEARNPDIRVVRLRKAFVFKRASGTQQRRLFLGPFVPRKLLRPGLLPVLPMPAGLQLQAVHTDDAAEAYRLAVVGDARGAFNIAAEPIMDGPSLARALGARAVTVPGPLTRAALAAAWRLHLVPAEPALLQLALSLPLMDTTRARTELGWQPRHRGDDALVEAMKGMAEGAGAGTEPLAPDDAGRRVEEAAGGVGQRDVPDRHRMAAR